MAAERDQPCGGVGAAVAHAAVAGWHECIESGRFNWNGNERAQRIGNGWVVQV